MRPFVFLDRDGTLIAEKEYLSDPDGVELTPGAADALRRLRAANFGIALITNQSGVARGYFTMTDVRRVHDRIVDLLGSDGAAIDAVYVCPHRAEDACACRKPGVALIDDAVREHDIDRARSFLVGDKESDIACGVNAGLRTILVRTGYGASIEETVGPRASFVAAGLREAVDFILALSKV